MSMTDALGRIDEIRSTLSQLSGAAAAKPAAAASATSTAALAGTDAEFASTLSSLTAAASTSPTASPAAAGAGAGDGKVLDAVQKYLGLPYIWGGNDPAQGLDCSSFVQNVYKDLGHTLPRVTWDQMNAGTEVASMAQAQPGDLLFSHDGGHVAIYLGNGKVVDAPQPGQTIAIRDAWETDANLTTIRRILPAQSTAIDNTGAVGGGAAVSDLVASARAAQAAIMGSAA